MSTLFALRAMVFGGELFAGSAIIMALGWLSASQKSASARHLVWTGAFAATILLPVLAAIMPSAIRIFLPAPEPVSTTRLIELPAVTSGMAAAPLPVTSEFHVGASTIAIALAIVWLAGFFVFALRIAVAATGLATARRHSRPFALAPDDLPPIAATHRECELRLSNSDAGPVTWGILRPVVLLPRHAHSWPRARLHAVLLHELAHIRRRDSLFQLLSLVVCALFWPNPLVWFGARALRREAEIAADDAVIVAGVKPSQYAGELLGLAGEFRTRDLAPIPLFMAGPSALEARVKSVLSPTGLRTGVTTMDVLKVMGVGLLATTAIAFACPSLAQETPPPAAPPAVSVAPIAPPAPVVPPAPDASSVGDTPSVPDAPPALPVPPVPAAPAADAHGDASREVIIYDDHHRVLTSADRARIHAAVEQARREAREAIAKAKPQIEEAMREARMRHDEAMRAVQNVKPQIDAAMAEVERSRPEIDQAMAEVEKAKPEIDKALADAKPQIDAALAKVRDELAKQHLDANIEVRVNDALKRAEIRIEAAEARAKSNEARQEERIEMQTDGTDSPDSAQAH